MAAANWYAGRGKMLEKPPEENGAATSGLTPCVLPTAVTLSKADDEGQLGTNMSKTQRDTDYGHVAGKIGTNGPSSHALLGCRPDTPPSPAANNTLVPRVPSCAKAKHRDLRDSRYRESTTSDKNSCNWAYSARSGGTAVSSSPKLVVRTDGGFSCLMTESARAKN